MLDAGFGSLFFATHAFPDSSCLAGTLAQVIELGASDMSSLLEVYFFHARRIEEKYPFNADALKYSPDSYRLAQS